MVIIVNDELYPYPKPDNTGTGFDFSKRTDPLSDDEVLKFDKVDEGKNAWGARGSSEKYRDSKWSSK